MKSTSLFALWVSILLAACSTTQQDSTPVIHSNMHSHQTDPHSFARPEEAFVVSLHWDAVPDFESKTISGTALYQIKVDSLATEIVFDTKDLAITSVLIDGVAAEFVLGVAHPDFGSPLTVQIKRDTRTVEIKYVTAPDAGALLWVEGEKPFLFTQSQAILARTWLPCQDSPGVRFTYTARVTVPVGLLALMSAENPQSVNATGVYEFRMDRPVPSYLMALAVGDIGFKSVGNRTGVYATPDMLDKAYYEFADMEKMLEAAEALYGAYSWGRYDLLILPPAFPFGGMENPMLTFATPTILAGDRSLVALVAHELAHSWSGNLVTNATWNDFWLNEGFTVYFEQRIMESVYGREHAEMLATLTLQGLVDEEEDIYSHHPEDTALQLDLEGRNPDDGLTVIAYDKGYFFLRLIEETTGRARFDAFLKQYFEAHAFQVMDTDRFLAYLRQHLITPTEDAKIDVKAWVFGQRIPANIPAPQSPRIALVDEKTQQWNAGTASTKVIPWESWVFQERYRFITNLNGPGATADKLALLDNAFGLRDAGNSEIRFAFLEKALRNDYKAAFTSAEQFLTSVGRRKFLTPLYKAMLETEKDAMANAIYTKARPGYHAVARETIDELLGKGH